MKKLLTLIWLGLMFLSVNVQAQTRQSYVTPTARLAMANWIEDNAPGQRVSKKTKYVKRVSAQEAHSYVDIAIRWANFRNLDPMLVLAIMRHESGFNPNARSPYGAQGLMQVVPRWHRDAIQGRSLFNPEVAIEVGTKVLRDCFDKFNGHTYNSLRCYLGGNPSKYYQRIEVTHVAMRTDVKKGWFVAEEPFYELPRMTQTAMVTRQDAAPRMVMAKAKYNPPPSDPIGVLAVAYLNGSRTN